MGQEKWDRANLFTIAKPHVSADTASHQPYLEPIGRAGFRAGQQQQAGRSRCLEANDQFLRLRSATLVASDPDGHVLRSVEGQRGRFATTRWSGEQGRGAIAQWPVPAFRALASVLAG